VRDTGSGRFAFYDTKEQALAVLHRPRSASIHGEQRRYRQRHHSPGCASGLSSGDNVTYRNGTDDNGDANAAIGGLKDGGTYYVRDTGGGNFSLYDTQAHAMAGGATGLVNLTGVGTGTGTRSAAAAPTSRASAPSRRIPTPARITPHARPAVAIIDSKDAKGQSSSSLRSAGQVKSPDVQGVDNRPG